MLLSRYSDWLRGEDCAPKAFASGRLQSIIFETCKLLPHSCLLCLELLSFCLFFYRVGQWADRVFKYRLPTVLDSALYLSVQVEIAGNIQPGLSWNLRVEPVAPD